MPFDIKKVPFFNAVTLFENGAYQQAFNDFIEVAQSGNLYAPYYVQYLLSKEANLVLQRTKKQKKEIKEILEFIDLIPQNMKPRSWLEASLCSIKLDEISKRGAKNKNQDEKERGEILKKLEFLLNYAGNAHVKYILELKKSGQQFNFQPSNIDLYRWSHLQASLPKVIREFEFAIINKNAALGYQSAKGGELESFMASSYYGNFKIQPDKKYDMELQKIKAERQNAWMANAAYMGNLNMQWIFTQLLAPADEERTLWHNILALKKEPLPQLMIGFLYITDEDKRFPKNLKKAQMLLQSGLKLLKGNQTLIEKNKHVVSAAYNSLGCFHEDGLAGFEKNDKSALVNYQEAAKLGHPIGTFNLGVFYYNGRGGLQKNIKEALECYLETLKLISHHSEALKNVAQIYAKGGPEIEVDLKKALQYYKLSSECGNIDSLAYYAIRLYCGRGVPPDENAALPLIVRAAQKGQQDAVYVICQLYLRDQCPVLDTLGISVDLMMTYLESVKDRMTPGLLMRYGVELCQGTALKKEETEGFKVLMMAAKNGSKRAALYLCRQHFNNSIPLSLGLDAKQFSEYLASAEKLIDKNPELIATVAELFLFNKDFKKAHELFLLGVEKKQIEVSIGLGWLHEKGCPELNIQVDEKRAYEYYCHAAEAGNVVGLNNKGYCLITGKGVLKNPKDGIEILEKALNDGYKLAAYNLARQYLDGRGVSQDFKKAFDYLKRAEEKNDSDVWFLLSICYFQGQGTAPNEQLGFKYADMAAQRGHALASLNCALITLKQACSKRFLKISELQKVQAYLKLPREKGYSRAIFMNTLIHLLIENDINQVPAAIKTLKAAQAVKPFLPTAIALELLTEKEKGCISLQEMVILLTDRDIQSVKEIRERCQKKVVPRQLSVEPAPLAVVPMPQNKEDKKNQRLIESLNNFIDPKNRRGIDIQQFNYLVGKVIALEGVEGEIKPSKGSNVNYTIKASNKKLHFSFHPTHRANAAAGSDYDPKRHRSLQEIAASMRDDIVDPSARKDEKDKKDQKEGVKFPIPK